MRLVRRRRTGLVPQAGRGRDGAAVEAGRRRSVGGGGSNFRWHDPYQRKKLSALAEHPVEVYCQCDPRRATRLYDVPSLSVWGTRQR